MRRVKISLIAGAAVVALIWLTGRFVILPTVVVGESMEPTLRPWDVVWMRRTRAYEPRRGDVVMFRTADHPPLRFIKRVVALPGETIALSNGVVWINAVSLAEPYTTLNPSWELPATNVPPGRVFVIGDNRAVPMDGAVVGLVATRLVEARMVASWRWRP
jgi:signal peptidase I